MYLISFKNSTVEMTLIGETNLFSPILCCILLGHWHKLFFSCNLNLEHCVSVHWVPVRDFLLFISILVFMLKRWQGWLYLSSIFLSICSWWLLYWICNFLFLILRLFIQLQRYAHTYTHPHFDHWFIFFSLAWTKLNFIFLWNNHCQVIFEVLLNTNISSF